MDLCPVRCLDMTRPEGPPVEAMERERYPTGVTQPWMMAFPVQIQTCIGCQICAQECPTGAITIQAGVHELPFFPRQGPVTAPPPRPAETVWRPLWRYTRAALDDEHTTPWGAEGTWQVAGRGQSWQSWRPWLDEQHQAIKAPCQEACPVGTNAGLYVSLIAAGRYDEALAVAAEPNPFPAICGRVCTAPCEIACRRGELDQPIAIRDLKRFASDHGYTGRRLLRPPRQEYSERVAIIGAGPTGLSAAYYLRRRGYQVTILEAMPVAGGMMAIGIPEYRLPRAELNRDIDAIRRLGVEIRYNTALGRDVTLDDLQREGFAAVLLAVGAQKSQRLNVPGEHLRGVIPATTFLKDYNLGMPTDLDGKVVAVIGGGSTAMDAARSAWRSGAREVHIFYRRSRAEMPAQAEEVRAALAEGIHLHELAAPVELLGANGELRELRCIRMALGAPDARGRRSVSPIPGSEFTVPVDRVLVAIGEAPDPSFLPEGSSIEVADWGGLLVNSRTLRTGQRGVFAAGDVTTGPKTVIDAAAQGRLAARSIHAFLRGLPIDRVRDLPEDEIQTPSSLPPEGPVILDLRPTPRAEMPLRDRRESREKMLEFALGFTEEQARREASRCLRCDLAYLCPTFTVVNDHEPAPPTAEVAGTER
jgi:NADPH-dependent glutamate synthase beta subunit-like oxidoreductase/NAD-dependent dihydropyrimidine dehydrogenase PreA subunit